MFGFWKWQRWQPERPTATLRNGPLRFLYGAFSGGDEERPETNECLARSFVSFGFDCVFV